MLDIITIVSVAIAVFTMSLDYSLTVALTFCAIATLVGIAVGELFFQAARGDRLSPANQNFPEDQRYRLSLWRQFVIALLVLAVHVSIQTHLGFTFTAAIVIHTIAVISGISLRNIVQP